MAKKVKLNAYVEEHLAKQFKEISKMAYGRIGICLSAAMLQFIESDPAEQGKLMKRVFDAEVNEGMTIAIEKAKEEQHRKIQAREQREKRK